MKIFDQMYTYFNLKNNKLSIINNVIVDSPDNLYNFIQTQNSILFINNSKFKSVQSNFGGSMYIQTNNIIFIKNTEFFNNTAIR
jgi:hypothetical protein